MICAASGLRTPSGDDHHAGPDGSEDGLRSRNVYSAVGAGGTRKLLTST